MICRVPFISLSCSRKCQNLLKENNLTYIYYKLQTNDIGIPINLNSKDLYNFFIKAIENKSFISHNINQIMININYKMDEFIQSWINLINNL